jgi:hypothetical protein
MVRRSNKVMLRCLPVKPCNTLSAQAGLTCGSLTNINNRLVCSTNVPTLWPLASQLMRLPYQWARNSMISISGGRTWMPTISKNLHPANLALATGHALVVRLAQDLYKDLLELPNSLEKNAVEDGLGWRAYLMKFGADA